MAADMLAMTLRRGDFPLAVHESGAWFAERNVLG
jgi:hypothetical protein